MADYHLFFAGATDDCEEALGRARQQLADARALLRALVQEPHTHNDAHCDGYEECDYCYANLSWDEPHKESCEWDKARRWLAREETNDEA